MTLLTDPDKRRLVWLACLLSVAGLLGYAYYQQYVEYLDPCPLCITQRLFYFCLAIVALIGAVLSRRPGAQRVLGALFSVAAIGGVATAGRHVWLQHLPPEKVPACGLGLQHWLETESPFRVLVLLFKGDGNCAEVDWTFLGFSMGEWSLAWFTGFLALGIALFVVRVSGRDSARARVAGSPRGA